MIDLSNVDDIIDDFVNNDVVPGKEFQRAPYAVCKERDELFESTESKPFTFMGLVKHYTVLGLVFSIMYCAMSGAAFLIHSGTEPNSAVVDKLPDVPLRHLKETSSGDSLLTPEILADNDHSINDVFVRHLGGSDSSGSSTNATSSHGSSSGHHRSPAFYPVAYMLLVYASSAVCKWACSKLPSAIQPPHSLLLFVFGMILGNLARSAWRDIELGEVIMEFDDMDPHIIFWLLLPALLFDDSCKANWHVTKRVLPSSLLLAIPGVMVNTCLTAGLLMALGTWTWEQALLLGSIASATDPVAVVAALHSLHAPEKLEALIAAESLFNDGSAVVLFSLFFQAANGTQPLEAGYSVKFFIQLSVCGPLLGLAFGLGMYIWLKTTRDYQIEVLVMTVAVFGSFFLAEHPAIHVSGVLAVVVLGFFVSVHGRFAFERANLEKHYTIIGFLALLSHEAIFVVAGVVTDNFIWSELITGKDWLELFFFYFLCHFTRGSVIALFYPALVRMGYGFMWKEGLLCLYGGLRGAVGLAMALLVHGDTRIGAYDRARCAFHVAGLALLTLLINGTTWPALYKKLHVYPHKGTQRALLIRACTQMDEAAHAHIEVLKKHWFFCSCKFKFVDALVPSISFDHGGGHGHDGSLHEQFSSVGKPSGELISDTLAAVARETARDEELRQDGAHGCRVKAQEVSVNLVQANLFSPTASPAPTPTNDTEEEDDPDKDKPEQAEQSREHIQTIINAAGQSYHHMFTTRTIRERPYLSLKDSVAYAEEALNGELKKARFFESDKELKDIFLPENVDKQHRNAFRVSWRYLVYRAMMFEGTFWNILNLVDKFVPVPDIRAKAEWGTMSRYVEALLVWIMTHEQLLSEMSMLSHLPAWGDLCETVALARVELLELYCGKQVIALEYEMFAIFQHILAARCALVKKVLVLFDNVRMGLLTHDSAKMVISQHIRPQMHALKHYRPSKTLRHELRKQQGPIPGYKPLTASEEAEAADAPGDLPNSPRGGAGAKRRESAHLKSEAFGMTASLRHQAEKRSSIHLKGASKQGLQGHQPPSVNVAKEDIERMKREAADRAQLIQKCTRRPGEQGLAISRKEKAEKNWQTGMKKALAVSRMAKVAGGNLSQIQALKDLPQADAGTGASAVEDQPKVTPAAAAKPSTGEAPCNSPEPAAGSTTGTSTAEEKTAS